MVEKNIFKLEKKTKHNDENGMTFIVVQCKHAAFQVSFEISAQVSQFFPVSFLLIMK